MGKEWWKKQTDRIYEKTSPYISRFKLFVSVFPGVGTVFLIFMKPRIVKSWQMMIQFWFDPGNLPQGSRGFYHIDWVVVVYFLFVIIWIGATSLFILSEANQSKRSRDEAKKQLENVKTEINAAIHNAPNPAIFQMHETLYRAIFNDFQALKEKLGTVSHDQHTELYKGTFRSVLKKIVLLTQTFSGNSEAIYGANLMGYLPMKKYRSTIEKLRGEKKSWIYWKDAKPENVRGVLHTLPELIIDDKPPVTAVTIPVLGYNNTAPGALEAAYGLTAVVVPNTAKLTDPENKARQDPFFEKNPHIRSFVSISIPVNGVFDDPKNSNKVSLLTGILNIDCSKIFCLGKEDKYYYTYFSLMLPIAYLFSPHLEEYINLTCEPE